MQRMRHGKRDMSHIFRDTSRPGGLYDSDNNWYRYFDYLCSFMPGTIRSDTHSWSSELPEMWMARPDSVLGTAGANFNFVNFTELPTDVFASRLQIVMNTFWDGTLNSTFRTGNLTSKSLGRLTESPAWNTTNALGGRYRGDQCVCKTTFAALTIVISWMLFLAASASVILGIVTRAPDVLGYVSTLARDDPYFETCVPSHLDGLEVTRLLRDVHVILGDVRQDADVGHVAFASMDIVSGRVSRKRLYD